MGSIKKRAKDSYWGRRRRRLERKKKKDEEGVDYVCHILRHDDKHVEPIWPTDTYSNNSTFFFLFSLPPLSLSIQRKGSKGREGGMGLRNMLTQANEREGTRGRRTKRPKSCGERRRKYSSCSSSFPLASGKSWCAPLSRSQEACVVTWSPGHVIQKFMGAHCFQDLGERRIFFLLHKHECDSMPNVFSTWNVTQTTFLFRLFPLSSPN